MQKPYVDIGFIVPLKHEFQRLTAHFRAIEEHIDGLQLSSMLDLGVAGLTGVAFLQDDMGKAAATRAADALITKFDVGVIAVVGIGGGLSNDVSLGDVCFTGTVIDVLENSKLSQDATGKQIFEFSSKFYTTDPLLSFAFKYVELGKDIKGAFEEWQLTQHYAGKRLLPHQFIGRGSKNEELGLPQIHEGSIVCGAVSKSDLYKSNLQSIERKVIALETESGGAFRSADLADIPAITIRGICDYADQNKNKLEEQTEHRAREVAADNVAKFLQLQLTNPQFLKYLGDRREKVSRSAVPLFEPIDPQTVSQKALTEVRQQIHEQLTHLSPEYRGKPAGYRLPLPRVKRSSLVATASRAIHNPEPMNILEAVTSNRVVIVGVPRNYPDSSLAWIAAGELILIEIDGKQVIPIVVPGEALKPPKGHISKLSALDIDHLATSDHVRPVFVITDFPTDSHSRVEFLRSEIERYPSARFLVINRAPLRAANGNDLAIATGAEQVDLCEISFAEMSNFFQRTFHIPDQEASVIALRMRNMFRAFRLNAHPSYFAGVASDVLNALLQANRRAELLQIAVGGFLSFVVANDRSGLRLSRTTREEFLRQLSFSKRVKGHAYDAAGLVRFVEEFAQQRDYEIDPLDFIRAFQDQGILHFDAHGVQISLPFVESYLLAVELLDRPTEAVAYFDLDKDDFDFNTFDIYSELGPSSDVVDSVTAALDKAIDTIEPEKDFKHILLTDDIRPAIVDRHERLKTIEQQLQKAFDDVVHSRPNSGEKQRLLDVAAQVEDRAKIAQESASKKERRGEDAHSRHLANSLRVWGAAAVLIGSGSERLDRAPKRALAGKIVHTTTVLLDRLLRQFSKVDFELAKTELQSDEVIRRVFALSEEQAVEQKHRDFIGAIVDAYEFSFIGFPIRLLFELLGNSAGQPVLRPSVASVASNDPIDRLVSSVWAAEIDAAEGKPALIAAIQSLPPTAFLRYTLSTYFMMRVFWNHWEPENRLALLDAAEEAVTPLNRRYDRGRIKRIIDRSSSKGDN